jgi:hypothetical protein
MYEVTGLVWPLYQNVLNTAETFLSEMSKVILINIKNAFTSKYKQKCQQMPTAQLGVCQIA